MMQVGLVYLMFLPSIFTTLWAGAAVKRFGMRASLCCGIAIAGTGLPMLLAGNLAFVLVGLALIAVGTFFAQAVATSYVGRRASDNKGVASGFYLACYFFGGLIGSAVLGQLFDRLDWAGCVIGIGIAVIAIGLTSRRLDGARQATQLRASAL
jgi:MFS family permease